MKTFKEFCEEAEVYRKHYILKDLRRRDREMRRRGVDPNNPSRMPVKQQPVFGSSMPRPPQQTEPTPRPTAKNFFNFKGALEV